MRAESRDQGRASLIRSWFDRKTNYCLLPKRKGGKLPLFSGQRRFTFNFTLYPYQAGARITNCHHLSPLSLSANGEWHARLFRKKGREKDRETQRCTFSIYKNFFSSFSPPLYYIELHRWYSQWNVNGGEIDPSIIPGKSNNNPPASNYNASRDQFSLNRIKLLYFDAKLAARMTRMYIYI